MGYQYCHHSSLFFHYAIFFLLNCSLSLATPDQPVSIVRSSEQITPLTAIKVPLPFEKRGEKFFPKIDCQHHYVAHTSLSHNSPSKYAKTSIEYKWPALVLEDIEDDLTWITCTDSYIRLQFDEMEMFEQAKTTWSSLSPFIVITSHIGCNEDGSRAPHIISNSSFHSDTLEVVLTSNQTSFNQAYSKMKVKFGSSVGNYQAHELRLHENLRRQIPPTVTYPEPPANTKSLSSTARGSVDFETDPDQQIFTYSTSTTDLLRDRVTIRCKECSIAGTIELTEGEFEMSNSTTLAFRAKDFIDHGYFKAVANGLKAHIELDTDLQLSNTVAFDKSLASIGLPGFSIPGIAVIGPMFQPHIRASIETKGVLTFDYGFDIQVPDNSTILMNISNITESESSGFASNITATPLTASTPELTVTFSLGLIPELLMGVDILNGAGGMKAGFFVNLPQLSVAISQTSNQNLKCENATNPVPITEQEANPDIDDLSITFPNLTHILPKAEIGVGMQAGVNFDPAFVAISESFGVQTILKGTEYPMPTTCLSWNGESEAFVTPTVTRKVVMQAIPTESGEAEGGGKGGEGGMAGSKLNSASTAARNLSKQLIILLLAAWVVLYV